MAISTDPFVGPIYIPQTTQIVPQLNSGASMEVFEVFEANFEQQDAGGGAKYQIINQSKKIPSSTVARVSLTNIKVLSGIVNNVKIERKPSVAPAGSGSHYDSSIGVTSENLAANITSSWIQTGYYKVNWAAGSTYNINIDMPIKAGKNPGGAKYDFRCKFYNSEGIKAKIAPNAPYTGNVTIKYITDRVYGSVGTIRTTAVEPSNNAETNPIFHIAQSMKNRVAYFVSESIGGAAPGSYAIPGVFCCYASNTGNAEWVYLQQLSQLISSSADNYPVHWGSYLDEPLDSPYDTPVVELYIYEDIIVDAQVPFNGIEDFSEIVGAMEVSTFINSIWQQGGETTNNQVRIGWKSMFATQSGWYTSANPYLTYSILPNDYGNTSAPKSGFVYITSGAWKSIDKYSIFMWVSTGSTSFTVTGDVADNAPFGMGYNVPGARAPNSGGGTWYLIDEIEAPRFTSSLGAGDIEDGFGRPEIEYVVSNVPQLKNVFFWIGCTTDRTEHNVTEPLNYEYETFIKQGGTDAMQMVKSRNNQVS